MWKELARIARRQAGVVTTRQALACGISARAFYRRVHEEGWTKLAAGVYLMPGHAVTDHARLHAAILAATEACHGTDDSVTPTAAVTGMTAAWLLGYADRPKGRFEVVIPHGQVTPTVVGVRFIRSRTLRPGDVGEVQGLPCATLARAVIDLAPTATAPMLRGLLIDARQRRASLDPVILRVAESTSFKGRGRLRRVLVEIAGDRVDSVFAALVSDWLRSQGIDCVAEYPIDTPTGTVHADLALVDLKIAIECDGFGAHSTRTSLNVDARRSNGLSLRSDWIVLRVTWDRWEHDRDGFFAEVRAAQNLQRQRLETTSTRGGR